MAGRAIRVSSSQMKQKQNVARCAAAVDRLIDRGEIAYGITTGFGSV